MNFNIDRDDNIFFDLKKWYDVEKYEEYKDSLTYNGMDLIVFINTVNALNKYEDCNLDVSLVNGLTLRLFDKETNESVAEYEIVFDLYESLINYLFKEIK